MLKIATVCTEEIWKDIIGYEGLYQVSNLGKVKSLDREISNELIGTFIKKGAIKIPQKRGNYLKVSLSKNGIINQLSVHRLVANEFVPNPQGKPCVNHLNGNKKDNSYLNLEWSTYSENTNHSYKNKLQISQKGSKHGQSKCTESDVIKMRELHSKGLSSVTELAKTYQLSTTTVSQIINRIRWTHI